MSSIQSAGSPKSDKKDFNNPQAQVFKQLSPVRWKSYMIEFLQNMIGENVVQKNMIKDLVTIVSTIPQSNFVQACLQLRPFKPQFIQEPALKGDVTQSTTASQIIHAAKFKSQIKTLFEKKQQKQKITQKTLKSQLNKEFHPYSFIIKNFCRLLQLKYKQLIDIKKMKVMEVQKNLRSDLDIFSKFMQNASKPYRKFFRLQKNQQEQKAYQKLSNFIQGYIFEHKKFNQSIYKIINYVCKSQFGEYLSQKIQNFVTHDNFDIPQQFKIDGSYARAMNSLMQFAESSDHQNSMRKMIQFRSNILKDIDHYYTEKNGQSKDLQLNAQAQIEIIRFVVAKLKNWSCQIYSQLKYLQVIYGDQQIAYKYEQGSFIYTQLSLVFQILQVE